MKKHLTTLEEKAHELWPTFDHQNPEAFWQKYEALLDQHKTQEAKISSTNQATVILPQIYPKTIFHPDALYLLGKLLTLSFPLLFVWGGIHQAADSLTIGQMTSVLLMSAIGWVIFTFFSATSICSFELTEHHLVIRNALFIVNKKVLWRRIQSIQVQKNNDPEGKTSYELVITDLIGFKQRFAYTLSAKNHQQLYQALSKRVTQIDAGGYQGYLG
ncbi:MAG TPA: hypothetical protein DCS93_00600 [Microscillaceae bacterium]|nr:hypothetical protein [Microscillaceae bacterium]